MHPAILKSNLEALRFRFPDLATYIEETDWDFGAFCVQDTRDGVFTVQCHTYNGDRPVTSYLHSKYAPLKEADRFASEQWRPEPLVVYGFGMGYHIDALHKKLRPNQTMTVYETNGALLRLAFERIDYRELISSPNITLVAGIDSESMADHLDRLLNQRIHLIVHSPSLRCMGDRFMELRHSFYNYLMPGISPERREAAASNYSRNKKIDASNITELFDAAKGRPAFIVSSGPSLNKNKSHLGKIKGGGIIICAGTALKPLLDGGVRPDYFCMFDPLAETCRQLEGIERTDIPMVFLYCASADAVALYKGPKYKFFNEAIDGIGAQDVISTGGSVATAAFSIGLKMGANPIVFVGQDLSYPSTMEHHADGKMYEIGETIPDLANYLRVQDMYGHYVSTRMNYLNYKRWFEREIRQYPGVRFINATEGGLPIEGARNIPLERVIVELGLG